MKLPKYFHLAKIASNHSDFHRHKIGCVITKHKPISFGYNQYWKRTSKYKGYFSIHAELKAILSSQTDLVGAKIYIYRQNKNGNYANSKPCHLCMEVIKQVGISKIYYTTGEYPYWKEVKL